MRKSVWLAPILALGLSTSAWAQQGVMTSKDRPDSVKVTVTFDADIDFVARMVGLATAAGFTDDDGLTTFEASAKVAFWVEFTEKVSFLISFANERVDGGPSGFMGLDGLTPLIWDLQIKVAEFLNKNVTVSVGTQNDLMFDVRGKGSSWYAPGKSQSFGSHSTTLASTSVPAFLSGSAGDLNTPTGIVLHYTAEGWTGGLALLPAVIEGGTSSDDEAAYFAWLYYDLASVGKGSRLGFLLATNSYSGRDTGVRTIGIGASLKDLAMPNSEIFVNIAMNNGDSGFNGVDTLTAKGLGLEAGFHYLINADSQQWVQLTFTQLSGDGDTSANEDSDNFLGYVYRPNGLLILEDPVFGLNWNTNYQCIKIDGGMSFTQGSTKNNVNVTVSLGLANTVEDVGAAPNDTTKLGTEFDVRIVWWHSKAVAMEVNLGVLSGSDVLELATGGPGGDSETSTQLFTLGWRIQG